jgi:hypothetical protein
MRTLLTSGLAALALVGVVAATSVGAQEPSKPQGGNGTSPGPASTAYKQNTQDGNSPTMVGPASGAYKQNTQGSPPMVGPASKAYKGE